MMQIINASDSLYLTPEEQKQLLEYAASLPGRLQAARAVEAKEDEIAGQCMALMQQRHPEFAAAHEHAWDQGHRDVQLVLRYNVQAMLMDDPDIAVDKLLRWLRTLLAGLGMPGSFLRDNFVCLKQACRAKLPADAFALLDAHLQQNITIMSDVPETALVAV